MICRKSLIRQEIFIKSFILSLLPSSYPSLNGICVICYVYMPHVRFLGSILLYLMSGKTFEKILNFL
jgi:hypothetical protein